MHRLGPKPRPNRPSAKTGRREGGVKPDRPLVTVAPGYATHSLRSSKGITPFPEL